MAESSFPLNTYNSCTIKDHFSFRYTSVATNSTKVGLLEVGLSGIWKKYVSFLQSITLILVKRKEIILPFYLYIYKKDNIL